MLTTSAGVALLACCGLAHGQIDPMEPFTEEAYLRGLEYYTFQLQAIGCGMAFTDLDGDGDDDFVAVGDLEGGIGIFENDGAGYFTHVALLSVLPMTLVSGVTAADYDGDGDPDLYISRHDARNILLRNEGGFVFTDVSEAAGVGVDTDGSGQGCAWADFDGDGWLDLYVANRTSSYFPGENRFYRNLGNGTFEELAASLGIEDPGGPTFQATFLDYDRNGTPDLYLCTDKGNVACDLFRNKLYRNDGGVFVDVTDESGTEACIGCMGTAIGDLDHNGYLDIYCTNEPDGNVLFLGQPDGVFLEVAEETGVAAYVCSWGTLFLDFDNNGALDLFLCVQGGPDRLYTNPGDGELIENGGLLGVGYPGASYTVATSDIDADGDLDMVVQSPSQPLRLYINHEGEQRHWLELRLVGVAPNTGAVGARVEVLAGGELQDQELHAGIGFKSSSSSILHFGLADADIADEIMVHWPGGATSLLSNVAADQRLIVTQPEVSFRRGDVNDDGPMNIADAIASLGFLFGGSGALPCSNAADVNDDEAVNVADPVYLLSYLFSGGPPPPEPAATCGLDETPGALTCSTFTSCP